MISLITFTGIDAATDLQHARVLADQYPFIEFGILLSLTAADKDSRYMSLDSIEHAAEALKGIPLALHICGSAVKEFVVGSARITALAARFGRVQLNFKYDPETFDIEQLDEAISLFSGKVITQHFPANFDVSKGVRSTNHQVLHDLSGGRGIAQSSWPPLIPNKDTGYAGGLGKGIFAEADHTSALEALKMQVQSIQAISGAAPVWIDMESHLRLSPEHPASTIDPMITGAEHIDQRDRFLSLKVCEMVCQVVEQVNPAIRATRSNNEILK